MQEEKGSIETPSATKGMYVCVSSPKNWWADLPSCHWCPNHIERSIMVTDWTVSPLCFFSGKSSRDKLNMWTSQGHLKFSYIKHGRYSRNKEPWKGTVVVRGELLFRSRPGSIWVFWSLLSILNWGLHEVLCHLDGTYFLAMWENNSHLFCPKKCYFPTNTSASSSTEESPFSQSQLPPAWNTSCEPLYEGGPLPGPGREGTWAAALDSTLETTAGPVQFEFQRNDE